MAAPGIGKELVSFFLAIALIIVGIQIITAGVDGRRLKVGSHNTFKLQWALLNIARWVRNSLWPKCNYRPYCFFFIIF